MRLNTWHDLETYSENSLKAGTHKYAEAAEVLIWAFASGDGDVYVWDHVHAELWWQEPLSEHWHCVATSLDDRFGPVLPEALGYVLEDDDALVWFQNGGMFDMVVLQHCMPKVFSAIKFERWRDTMVQAFAHGCPGALEKLGWMLRLNQEDKKQTAEGKKLIRLFCMPQKDGSRNTRDTHPAEWQKFIQYAGQDIVTMREAHRKLPKWNYGGESSVAARELRVWQTDLKVNYRGVCMDLALADNAIRAVDQEKKRLAAESARVTLDSVPAATQRDVMLEYLLAEYGVDLPDMRADTLERRLNDDSLPDPVRELIAIRLQASQNAASKYKALRASVSRDGRLRGTKQYGGAQRTLRWAGRLMQMDNMPRPNIKAIAQWHGIPKAKVKGEHIQEFIDAGIDALKYKSEDLVFEDVMAVCGTVVRGTIVAAPGKKLVVADLANIEGRFAAWVAGETWKIQAFLDYDTIVGTDEKGEPVRKGPDLYRLSYAKAFNIALAEVTKENRQVGKVMELMLQYQGGVGAFITGAATYELDLEELTDAAWPVLPADVIAEARSFMHWLYGGPEAQAIKGIQRAEKRHVQALNEGVGKEACGVVYGDDLKRVNDVLEAAKLKARLGLSERVFVVCDSLKRLWRRAHPAIVSFWKGDAENPGIEWCVRRAIENPSVTYTARKLRIRRDGAWLRVVLPSGRALCYPDPRIENDKITFMGLNQYTRQWGRVSTYGGKVFENCIAVNSLILTEVGWLPIQHVTSTLRVWDGVEWVRHGGRVYKGKQSVISVSGVGMTPEHRVLTVKGWRRASSCEGLDRADCRLPDGFEVCGQQREEVSVGIRLRVRQGRAHLRGRSNQTESPRHSSILRVHAQSDDQREKHQARDVVAPGLRCVAQHARQMLAAVAPVVAQLRRAGHQGVRSVARFFRSILGGHGAYVLEGVDVGAGGQRQGVLPAELRVAHPQGASEQHASHSVGREPLGADDTFGFRSALRSEANDSTVPIGAGGERLCLSGASGCVAEVYDLVNCGPRQRFTVRSAESGVPMIVHNCCQAGSRDQLAEGLAEAEDNGYCPVQHVHDEIICEVDDNDERTHEGLARLMCARREWNQGLPLAAAGFTTYRYRKD